MTTTKRRIDELYAQVVSRLDGDPQEGRALLDELLFNCEKAIASGASDPFEVSPGRPCVPWHETAELRAKVEQLRKTKSLSTRDALLEIYSSTFLSEGTGARSKGNKTKANAWAKTKANQISAHRRASQKGVKILGGSNIEPVD